MGGLYRHIRVCDSWLKSIRGKGLAVEVDGNLLPPRSHWRHAGRGRRENHPEVGRGDCRGSQGEASAPANLLEKANWLRD
jgi:hypothetical protein